MTINNAHAPDWLDEDGYPTEVALERIKTWPWEDMVALFDFMRSIWWAPDWGWTQDGVKFDISTAGWSGNESIIEALEANRFVWGFSWQSSRRGGHYEFTIPGQLLKSGTSHAI